MIERYKKMFEENINKKIFLGGTCNNSNWRDILIPMLTIDYFNPIVDDWTPECQEEEIRQRELCDYCLYYITKEMIGVYSIAEAVDDSNKRPNKIIFAYDPSGFTKGQIKSLDQVKNMISSNGGTVFKSLEEIANYVNK